MQEPWTAVVSLEPYGNIVPRVSNRDYISLDWVEIVIVTASSSSDDTESML